MAIKSFQSLMSEAKSEVPAIDPSEAMALHQSGEAVFLDVRDQAEIQQARIPGAVPAPRGFMEFIVTDGGPSQNPALSADSKLVVYCAGGVRSLLAAKILKEMGYQDVLNLTGGIQGWAQSGGPVDQ